MTISLVTTSVVILLIVTCWRLYSGESAENEIDKSFLRNINYRSLHEDHLSKIEGYYRGSQLEIINLRRHIYDRTCEEYGRPKRYIRRRYFYNTEKEYGFSAKYMIESETMVMFWDYGKTIKDFYKKQGIDERIYWLNIHILPKSTKLREEYN